MRPSASPSTTGTAFRHLVLASVLAVGLATIGLPAIVFAADPAASPDSSTAPTSPPTATPTAAPTATPTSTSEATPTATPDPTTTPAPDPTPTPAPDPTPAPAPSPTSPPPPYSPPAVAPRSIDLFAAAGFRYQDPNWAACTATSVRTMLNLVSMRQVGGAGFRWQVTNSAAVRDAILAWERKHDTMPGGYGSDPHGWRNALNFYGWGPEAVIAGSRVYDDYSYPSFDSAMKAAVRAIVSTGKPVGLLSWRGAHAQMVTGYYGLAGNPFDKDATGRYTNAFSVAGFYLTDPLRSSLAVNRATKYSTLKSTSTFKLRFQRYYETDSKFDDPYTPGYRVSTKEWYGRFTVILPIR